MGLKPGASHPASHAGSHRALHRAASALAHPLLSLALALTVSSCAAGAREASAARPVPAPARATVTTTAEARPCDRCVAAQGPDGRTLSAGLTGVVKPHGEGWVLEGCAGTTQLADVLGEGVTPLVGREVWIYALCTGEGRAAALGGHAVGDSVIDLFVMGLCPAARSLERQIARRMAGVDSARTPRIRLHAIFYARDSAGTQVYFAKHGAAEVRENVVQLSLQELEPGRLWAYLGARASSDEDWVALASQTGVSWRTVAEIQRRLEHELQTRAGAAWNDTALNWPTIEASPTLFWRGYRARAIEEVPGLADMSMTQEPCTN